MACAESNAAAPVKTLETAVDILNSGKSATEVYKLLSSVKRFRAFLPKEAPKPVFAVPSNKTVNSEFGMLGKRNAPEKEERQPS